MDLEHLRELVRIFEAADVSEIEIEEKGSRVMLRKHAPVTPPAAPQTHMYSGMPGIMEHTATPAAAPAGPPAPVAPEVDEGLLTINSPMVGVFYSAPAPGEPPFIRVNDRIEAGDTVCIVEAMKLMNEVTAKFPCVIENVLVENAEPVEYDQPLFTVRPVE